LVSSPLPKDYLPWEKLLNRGLNTRR